MIDKSSTKQTFPKEKGSDSQTNRRTYLLLNIAIFLLSITAILPSIIIWHRLFNITQLTQSLSKVQVALQQTQTQMQRDIATSRNKIAQLIMSQTGKTRLQQRLAETACLIQLAHFYLTAENNSTFAIRLLKIAQLSLQSLPSGNISSLKKAINQDLSALSAIPQIDIVKLYDQLDQLKSEIAKLPMQSKIIPLAKTETIAPLTLTTRLGKIEHNYLEGLKNLFLIHRIDHPAFPLLGSRQILFLKENLQLKLVEIQWALLNRDSFLYQKSLDTTIQWLTNYNSNQPKLAEIIKKMRVLATINLKPLIPRLQALQAVNCLVI